MSVYLDANLTTKTYLPTNSADNGSTVKSRHDINNSSGITGTSEVGNTSSNIGSTGNIPMLEAPQMPLEEAISTVIKLDTSKAQKFGVAAGTSMTFAEFTKAILEKLDTKSGGSDILTKNGIDISKMDAETLDLFCMLLCQSSKEKMIATFKELLNTKVKERNEKQQAYAQEVDNVTKKNVEAAKKQKEAERKAKKWGIFKAIFGAIAAVVTAVIAVAVTVASAGTLGPIALGIACLGCSLAIASAGLSVAASGVTIASLCTDDPEKKAKLDKWSMGLGLAAAATGIAGAVLSGGASFFSSGVGTLTKILNSVGSIASGLAQIAGGATDIVKGINDMELAELQRNLANMKIDLTKLDETIALLNQLIENLSEDAEAFIKNFLEGEQQAAKELINISDAQSNIENEMPC